MVIHILEGPDYAGKSESARILTELFGYNRYFLTDEEKRKYHSMKNPEDKFKAYYQLNFILHDRMLQGQLNQDKPALIERLWPSAIAYYNTYTGGHLEQDPKIQADILKMKPDRIILITTNLDAIERRMLLRPPKHKMEADPKGLMKIQEEYKRLLPYLQTEFGIPFTVIENFTENISELERSLQVLKNM